MDEVVPGMATVDAVRRWLGATGAEVLIVGHTHVPCVLSGLEGGMIGNPGALRRDRVGGDLPAPVIFDPQKGTFVESQAAPRGTFGALDLPSKQFTVYLASDGSAVPVPVVKADVADRQY